MGRKNKRSHILVKVRKRERSEDDEIGRRGQEHMMNHSRNMPNNMHLIRLTLQSTVAAICITLFNKNVCGSFSQQPLFETFFA
jgi:hypothetical protein